MGYLVFLLVNAALYMRPTEIFPEYLYEKTYLVLILTCLALSLFAVTKQLGLQSLVEQPITACILGLLVAVVMSQVVRFAVDEAIDSGWDFAKITLYYLFFVGLVKTPGRLRLLLFCLACFIATQAVVGLLAFYRLVDLINFDPITEEQRVIYMFGREMLTRICGSGIFHNPNEFCYALVLAIVISLYYLLGKTSSVLMRFWCVAMLGALAWAFSLTHSRGGFIALLIALLTLLLARFGWRKALPYAAVMVVLLFVLFGGRQTNLDVSTGTGQNRIQLWGDGLALFMREPVFGIGYGNYQPMVGLVAHNTFVQCYTELGAFGGTCFLGAFYCAIVALYSMGKNRTQIIDPEMCRLQPYLMAIVAGHIGIMLSNSLHNMVPTYAVLALVVAYERVTAVSVPVPMPRFNGSFIQRTVVVSVLTLLAIHFYVRYAMVVG